MSRIRTIKPEWLDDEKLMIASSNARVLSVALILLSDDYGNGVANELNLAGRVWGAAASPEVALDTCRAAFDELMGIGYVTLYHVNGQRYYHITNWNKHQRVDKPGRPQVPGPARADATAQGAEIKLANDSRMSREHGANEPRINRESLAPDREKEKEEEEEGSVRGLAGLASLSRSKRRLLKKHGETALALWQTQNELRKKACPGKRGLKATAAALVPVAEVLESGYSAEDCEAVLRHYAEEASKNGGGEWFNGETNWRPANFKRALGMSGTSKPSYEARMRAAGYEVTS